MKVQRWWTVLSLVSGACGGTHDLSMVVQQRAVDPYSLRDANTQVQEREGSWRLVASAMEEALDATVHVESHVTHESMLQRIQSGDPPDLVVFNSPYLTLEAMDAGYHVISPVLEPYRAVLVRKRDDDAVDLSLLRSTGMKPRVALKGEHSASGKVMPVAALRLAGFEPDQVRLEYFGDARSVAASVLDGTSDLGALPLPMLDARLDQDRFEVVWTSELLPAGAFLVHSTALEKWGGELSELQVVVDQIPHAQKLVAEIPDGRHQLDVGRVRRLEEANASWLDAHVQIARLEEAP